MQSQDNGRTNCFDAPRSSCNCSNDVFWLGPKHRRSFSDKILDALKSNEQLFMFDDVFFTPDTSTLIDLAHQLIGKTIMG